MDESPLHFIERWTRELRTLRTEGTDPARATAAASRYKALAAQLTDRASDLPASELGRCQRELGAAQNELNGSKATSGAGKPRFAFSRRKAPTGSGLGIARPDPTPTGAAAVTTPPAATESPRLGTTDAQKLRSTPADALTLTTRSDALLSASDLPAPNPNPAAASAAQSLALSSLSRCVVDLLPKGSSTGAYSATYLSSLRYSLVLLPDAQQKGSVLLQGCERCVIVLGGHQIRIHDSADCLFLLAAGSAPIIERCRGLVFAPYPASLVTSPPEHAEPDLAVQVQDFDDPFASAERPSRNWRAATADEVDAVEGSLSGWRAGGSESHGWSATLQQVLAVVRK
ncbi:hypothetical protein JCM8202_002734 [Rhodotorula sphaerocarpa]